MEQLLDYMKKSLPKYVITQPSTQKKVNFTPFTVKDEKSLLMSNSTGNKEDFLTTIGSVIESCFSLDQKIDKVPIFDVEYFFIKLRCKSVGEIVETTIICPYTNEKINIVLNLDEIEPVYFDNHNKKIKFDNMIITMRYPVLSDFIAKNQNEDYYDLLIRCIETIETPKEIIETQNYSSDNLKEFLDLLTKQQFNKLIDFFKTMPKIQKKIEYQTSDGTTREIILRGVRDFFQ
jgi:hypothetical protein